MASTSEYRAEQDFLHKFIDEMCTVSESAICLRTDLHAAYAQWCNTDQNDSDEPIRLKTTREREVKS